MNRTLLKFDLISYHMLYADAVAARGIVQKDMG